MCTGAVNLRDLHETITRSIRFFTKNHLVRLFRYKKSSLDFVAMSFIGGAKITGTISLGLLTVMLPLFEI
jgi:hypothetical protein